MTKTGLPKNASLHPPQDIYAFASASACGAERRESGREGEREREREREEKKAKERKLMRGQETE